MSFSLNRGYFRHLYLAISVIFIGTVTAWLTFTTYSAGHAEKPAAGATALSASTQSSNASQRHLAKNFGRLPLSFEANRGQTDSNVAFLTRGVGYQIFFTPAETIMVFRGKANSTDAAEESNTGGGFDNEVQDVSEKIASRLAQRNREASSKPSVVRMRFDGASSNAAISGADGLPGKVNYFIGNDSSKWLTDVPTYSKVTYSDVYPGIDLVYYGNEQELEYDLVVDPGANPEIIKLNFDGAESVRINRQGNLIIKTDAGEVTQSKPKIYQEVDGHRKEIGGRYALQGGRIGFKVSKYDRSKPLVIDPILSYLSMVNGSGDGIAIAVDSTGSAYLTGIVFDANLNPTPGAFQTGIVGSADAFVTKLNPAGNNVIFTTYLGGSGFDYGNSVAFDASGNVYVGGGGDGTFPTTGGALQSTNRGYNDGFITKLSPTGSALIFSTLLGGNSQEEVNSVAIETGTGNVLVSGLTASSDLNSTPGAFRTTNSGGYDAFVAKVNSNGSALIYLTYLGGSGFEYPVSMTADPAGNVYVGGYSSSVDYPTQNPIQAALGGAARGFFKSSNSGVNWSSSKGNLPITVVYATAIDPTNPSIVYVGTDGGVFKTTNGGSTWNPTGTIATPRVLQLFIVPSTPNVVYAGTETGVYKSTNGGANWVFSGNGFPNAVVTVRGLTGHASAPNTVYAGTLVGVFKTTDGGSTWNPIQTGLPTSLINAQNNAIVVDPTNANTVYVAVGGGQRIYKSVNGGANWTASAAGFPNTTVRSLAIAPNGTTLYAATALGVYRSTNSGANWSAANTGLSLTLSDSSVVSPATINAFAIDPVTPANVYAGAFASSTPTGGVATTTIFKSTDGGNTWSAQSAGFGTLVANINSLAIDPTNTTTVFAGTAADSDGIVFKLNPTGSAVSYSTYIGGERGELISSIALDSANNVYVNGATASLNFPTTPGAYQTTLKGSADLFLTKVNSSGSHGFSTLIGGTDNEGGSGPGGVEVDSLGSATITSSSFSTDYPVTSGAFQTTIGNPGIRGRDLVVTSFNPTGTALVYSSYLGGGGDDDASLFFGKRLAMDADGNAYVLGVTSNANNFPAFDSVNSGPFPRTFVAKINPGAASYSITGRITTPGNAPVANVGVDVLGPNGFERFVLTDAQGYYAFISLPAGAYTVTPTRDNGSGHFLFSPTSRSFPALNSDQQNANFTATQVFDIDGRITNPAILDQFSNGVFDVTVSVTGSANVSTVTNANGFFTIRGLQTGNYTVTPSKPGFVFTPANRVFNGLNSDQFADFTTSSGTYFTVSGRAADGGNNGIAGAEVSMLLTTQRGQRNLRLTTDANGNYSFPNLQSGGNYSFTIARPLFTFTPQSPSFPNLSANQTVNFTGSPLTGLVGKISFISDSTNLSLMNADTTGEVNLTPIGGGCDNGDSGPSWSPDGARIAFSRCDSPENANLYTIKPDGTGLGPVVGGAFSEIFPSWSPDAARLTYTYGQCSGTDVRVPDVFSTDVAGSIQTQLTNTPITDGQSDWSPNGSTIIFTRVPDTDCSSTDADLYAIDAVGGNERRLTNTVETEFRAVHSPDGTRIAYVRDFFDPVTERFSQGIFVMNPDGTNQTRVTHESIFADAPTWSPDGTRIAFHGALEGAPGISQIFVVNADGTGLAQLTGGVIARENPSWQHFSISGKINGITDGQPINVALAGTLTRVTQTDENGNYIFGNLTPGGNYSVSPVSTAFVFNPSKTDISNLQGNQIANFNIVPQSIPAPTPPLADDFNAGQRDPEKWNLGTQTQPLGAFDPQVTVVQQGGQLVITPRSNQTGLHYNGYVSVNSFDFNNATATVELAQAAGGTAQTIFAIGSDLDNFSRFIVTGGPVPGVPDKGDTQRAKRPNGVVQLIFQVVVGGQLTTASVPYDPVAHRFMRFRHEPPTNAIVFETSPNNIDFTERHRVVLQKSVSALTAELSAGTSNPTNPGTASFDNFQLVTNTFQFSTPAYTVNESAGSVAITVTRAGSTTSAATVDFSTFDGTAQQRTKYIPAVGVLSFAAGETSKTFDVLIQDNFFVEGSQTVSLRLLSSFGAGLNSPGQGILTINDNDSVAGTTNPLDQPEYFVRQQYFDFLNRAPDPGGFSFWLSQITSCPQGDQACVNARRIRVSNAFFYEQEFQLTGAYVYRLYRAAYGNNQPFPNPDPNPAFPAERAKVPSYQVFVSDRARVVGGANLAQSQLDLATAFVLRDEFLATYPRSLDGPAFVDAILAKIKNDIGPDLTSQRSVLISNFNQGGRGLVMFHLANDYWNDCNRLPGNPPAPCLPAGFGPSVDNRPFVNAEYSRAFVVTQYFGYLRRDADMGGLLFWLGQVNRFPLRNPDIQNAMVCSFITSAEYQQRFSSAVTHTNQECPQ